MKIISDIRLYKSSETENHVSFASKSLNLAVRRVAMKLREQQFSLGAFDHLYLNFTVCQPVGTITLIDEADPYHPWYRYCDIGVSLDEYRMFVTDDCTEFVYEKIEAVLLDKFCSGEAANKTVKDAITEAKKGPEMLMLFKEKKSAKNSASIYLRLLDNGNYRPLLCVNDLDGKEILRADLPETVDLGIIGSIQLSSKKVTINPRNNAFTKNLQPITFPLS